MRIGDALLCIVQNNVLGAYYAVQRNPIKHVSVRSSASGRKSVERERGAHGERQAHDPRTSRDARSSRRSSDVPAGVAKADTRLPLPAAAIAQSSASTDQSPLGQAAASPEHGSMMQSEEAMLEVSAEHHAVYHPQFAFLNTMSRRAARATSSDSVACPSNV